MIGSNKDYKIFLLLLLMLGMIGAFFLYTAKKKIGRQAPSAVRLEKSTAPARYENVNFTDDAMVRVKIGETEIPAEVAKSDAKKRAGLGKRESLDKEGGMLFVFDSLSDYPFWNKDMLFPIDIIWIKDGAVVDVSENMPDFKTSPGYTATPQGAANLVLEVNAGLIKEKNIKAGDKVEFK